MTVRRPPSRVGGALSCLGLLGLLVLTGCTEDPGAAVEATGSSSASPTAVPTTSAPPTFELPATCAGLLTLSQVDAALGVRLPGTTTYVVGEPEPGIGRTGRITCGYGVTPATATAGASDPLLEVSVFTYTDAQAAADRVTVLVDDQQAQGVRTDPAVVPGADAVLFTGPADTTLVATVAERTYALTLVPGLLDPAAAQVALQELAAQAAAAGTTTSPSAGGPTGTSSTD